MSFKCHYASLVVFVFVILISHSLMSEGIGRVRKRKYYPEEPPVKSLVLENGDVVDCVDFYSQPAMSYPHVRKLYKHQLQSRTRLSPRETKTESESDGSLIDKIGRIGLKQGSCPQGSVPFLKATKAGPLNYSAIDILARSHAKLFDMKSNSTELMFDHRRYSQNVEVAIASAENGQFSGVQGYLNIWQPTTEDTEFSASVIQLIRHSDDNNYAMMSTGWMVSRRLFGDHRPRFIGITTPDSYRTSLYYNRRVPPQNNLVFIQVSETIFQGNPIEHISVYQGQQKELLLKIRKDPWTRDWNLIVDGEVVGFWPKTNYREDFNLGNKVRWGGHILNLRTRGRHTSTHMGSGHFAREGIGKAAYIRNMGVYDRDLCFSDAPYPLTSFMTNRFCYDIRDWNRLPDGQRTITFGGSGYDAGLCS